MRSQRLAGGGQAGVAEVVHSLVAMQAQSTRDARLAVRPRADGVDATAVAHACNQARSVVRTWAMRVTLHMLAAPDVGWIVDLYRPPADTLTSRQRQLGLDEDLLARAMPAVAEILGERGPLTRGALVAELARVGVTVNPAGQAPAHLVSYAARQGLICRGADQDDDEPTYVLLAGEPAWADPELLRSGTDTGEPCVRLVPHFDEYLLSYRSRALALPPVSPAASRPAAAGSAQPWWPTGPGHRRASAGRSPSR
jgi:Winged helix DNA-binding domain